MTDPTKQIKQIVARLRSSSGSEGYVKTLRPKRDWLIGIGVATCIVVAITTWNGYTYFSNRDGGSTETETEIQTPRYQAALIDEALTVFAERANEFTRISGGQVISPVIEAETVDETATNTDEVVEEEIDLDQTEEITETPTETESENDSEPPAAQESEVTEGEPSESNLDPEPDQPAEQAAEEVDVPVSDDSPSISF